MKSKHDFPSLNSKQADGIRPNGIPYKVLIVEDQEFQRKQIRQILESEKYEIIADVANGRDALKVIEKLNGKIDLITTDLDMPILDGYALLFELKNNLKFPIKVVFISDETTKGVVGDLVKMGALDFILKPLQRQRLLERIKLAVNR